VPDAAVPDAAVPDAASDPQYREPTPGGCRCRFGAPPASHAQGALALLLALGVSLRRRTRVRR
jgi:MYXO-CTERM domain-containing protein